MNTFAFSSVLAPLKVSVGTLDGVEERWLFHFFLVQCGNPDDVEDRAVDVVDLLSPVSSDITVPLVFLVIALGNLVMNTITRIMTSLGDSTRDLNDNDISYFSRLFIDITK